MISFSQLNNLFFEWSKFLIVFFNKLFQLSWHIIHTTQKILINASWSFNVCFFANRWVLATAIISSTEEHGIIILIIIKSTYCFCWKKIILRWYWTHVILPCINFKSRISWYLYFWSSFFCNKVLFGRFYCNLIFGFWSCWVT